MIPSKISLRDFCFFMKIASFRSACSARGPGPLNSISITCLMAFPQANLSFKSILSRKNWRGGGGLFLLKKGTIDGYAYN